ncbi:CDP-glycerol glycerophosphotransferase family protein [Virgibacillus sp. 179-BFC.A HS]|uniref:CDP-glycerol glycerophosphotransferase family protein n=1 Tax=Tigheibacillus jepli TaxID=3035914 RepID=A0ABU5CFK6_9BACI|nr:CDP-glycerol glycerophosphotransferase family protein [Virgibacillus sp. 179-BFC.A HS]MDY0404624.1 CDP-glycerol glycerophosphotransferase family protein [Virgibacillus sp. 179-BFC.A HS]
MLVFGSKAHFDIAFQAKVLLCTHDMDYMLPYKAAKGFFHYEDTFKVFLQHGVIGRKNVEYHKSDYEVPFDLFIVSSESEKQLVVVDKLGYAEEEVAVTGLARFDNLLSAKKPETNDILLMPTWRDWTNTDQRFLESEYFRRYTDLINDERLMEMLEQYQVNLTFYPHYRAQKYFQQSLQRTNQRVQFIEQGEKTVQELLIAHSLLITDYSSVSFDFMLMNKPVIYYHFDTDRFFKRGMLRPINDTFLGPIAHTQTELVQFIADNLQNQFANNQVDTSPLFAYRDGRNCKRIYEAVTRRLQA